MGYLLDANVMIASQNLHHGFDCCPGFWNWLLVAHDAGKIKIPDVCIGLGMKCMTPFQMLRLEGARFVLESAS